MKFTKKFVLFGHLFYFAVERQQYRYTVATTFEDKRGVYLDHFNSYWLARRFAKKAAFANCMNFDMRVNTRVVEFKSLDLDSRVLCEFCARAERKVVVSSVV